MKRLIPIFFLPIFCLTGFLAVDAADLQIKPGNIVHITVLNYPELSKAVFVREDGSTDYPLLAGVPIDGMTIHQLQEVLQPILARFVERPKLFINIADYLQLEVTVQGQVKNPGLHTVKGPINLQGVLSIAGGTTELADLRNIGIIRRGFDHQQGIQVDLYKFFMDRDNTPLPEITDGDIVFVPIVTSRSVVRVMGAVRAPGPYIPVQDESVADMINMAGGPVSAGNINRIQLISMRDGKLTSISLKLKDLINDGLTDQIPLVKPGDIIVVGEYAWWQKTRWWVDAFRDVAIIATSIVVLSRL